MRKNHLVKAFAPFFIIAALISSCNTAKVKKAGAEEYSIIEKKYGPNDISLELSFQKGEAHNHPTMAVWLENTEGDLIQTIYVTRSIAKGYYQYGDAGDGTWLKVPGKSIRPAALPFWLHKREKLSPVQAVMPSPESALPDAYTGATPAGSFKLAALTEQKLPQRFKLLVEVNQPWDWNNYWNNNKHPGDLDYRTSAQPSLIYAVDVNLNDVMDLYYLNPVGHGSYNGSDGKLYTDLSGYTTAFKIFNQISLTIKK